MAFSANPVRDWKNRKKHDRRLVNPAGMAYNKNKKREVAGEMTEIFGTLGPACAQADILGQMFSQGMTGMRLNLSYSGLKESGALIGSFFQAAQRSGIRPQLLMDMQGPEIRIGNLQAPLQLNENEEIEIGLIENGVNEDAHRIPVAENVLAALEAGSHILLDDGKIELVINAVSPRVLAGVLRGGVLHGRKSLKIAGRQIPGPVLTSQDREQIRLAKDYGVTALMQPFVTNGAQLEEVRHELRKNHMEHLRVFAKIENREGMSHIHDILPHADMLVIARGDLGNDMPLWELPAAQQMLSAACRSEGKPFLVVTQLLASMVHSPYPTRAEVSDIFHAVRDGAAAVMVTNETAVGDYPVQVIRYLKKTVQEAEKMR